MASFVNMVGNPRVPYESNRRVHLSSFGKKGHGAQSHVIENQKKICRDLLLDNVQSHETM
jgi:hypothetical protein